MGIETATALLAEDSVLRSLLTKQAAWEATRRGKAVDLVVLGGSFAAAAFSHGAAFNGLSVVVITPEDLGANEKNEGQSISWAETADRRIAWPAQASRRYGGLLGLLHAAPHLVKAQTDPSISSQSFAERMLKQAYRIFLQCLFEARSGEKPPRQVMLNPYLLTAELWLSAKYEGAKVLPCSRVIKSQGLSSRQFELTVQDLASDNQITLKAGAVVDFDSAALRKSARSSKSLRNKSTSKKTLYWQNIDGYFVPPTPDLLSDRLAAFRGLAHILLLSDATRIVEVAPFAGRKLPGAGNTTDLLPALLKRGIGELDAIRLINRYGYQARFFLANNQWLESLPGGLFTGEVYFALLAEGCVSLEGFAKSLGLAIEVTKEAIEAVGIQASGLALEDKRAVATG